MTASELLRSATYTSINFAASGGFGSSQSDYLKLKKLFYHSALEAKSFDDVEIDIVNFNWQEVGFDRNWWWQLQSLPFLEWFIKSFDRMKGDEAKNYYKICCAAMTCWVDRAMSNPNSPLAWHDHTVAYRLRNLSNWLLFCSAKEIGVEDDPVTEVVADLIFQHLDWLQDDKNYSKHTNHGFDQALAGLTVALMYRAPHFDAYRETNRVRLKGELNFAFTAQGVHKENSLGYQKTMIQRLRQLQEMRTLGECEISQIGERLISDAEHFLAAVTLPNGQLPMIGDTRGGYAGLPYLQKCQIDICDFSDSGYVIVRGTVLNKDFHMIFKNSHFSHYHRHDDDLSVHLYFGGAVLLGDGGLGSHNENDVMRKTIRSSISHNLPHIVDVSPLRIPSKLNGFTPRTRVDGMVIEGESYSHGYAVRRRIDLSGIREGSFIVEDSCTQIEEAVLASNLYSNLGFSYSDCTIHVADGGEGALRIEIDGDTSVERIASYYSYDFGKFEEVSSLRLTRVRGQSRNTVRLKMSLT
ncbi:MAG: heparinase II/III family protein [Paracoccus sp. (in: a-proteobacteria)]|nr:heparinase II/III family protein [Paracoccus sp. (in: a-proteobacteria)]